MTQRKIPSDDILRKLYLEDKLSSGDIAEKYNMTRQSVCRCLRRLDIVRPESGSNSRNRNFKTKQYRNGYPVTFLPEHPRSNHLGYVFDHVLEMEKKMGKTPLKSQPIHHIDFNRENSLISNLYQCSSHKEHKKIHAEIEKIIKILFDRGEIIFENGGYILK